MSKLYNTKFKPTKVGIIKAVGQKIGSLIKGKGKVSPTITKVPPAVGKSKIKKAIDDVKLTALKTRGQMKKQSQDFDGAIRKVQTKIGQTSQKLKGEKVTESGFTKGKDLREKRMGGGMMGRRFGMKKGTNPFKKETNVDKIKKAFDPKKSDLNKDGKLTGYEKKRGMAIAKAMAKRKKKA